MLFAHWAIEPESLQSWLPTPLTLNTFDKQAWIGIVAFEVAAVRVQAGDSSTPIAPSFLNLNLRTYVEGNDGPGIYFLSSDVGSRAAATIGRRLFGFSVYQARMKHRNQDGERTFQSERVDSDTRKRGFKAQYESSGEAFQAEPDSIDEFLTEQSRYYIAGEPAHSSVEHRDPIPSEGSVQVGEISQPSHELRSVDANIQLNTLFEGLNLEFMDNVPVLHYCDRWEAGWNPLQSA
jgi:uncharacterized protein YqjF (DUF2071 family)